MGETQTLRKRKLFEVAKELNLSHTTLMEFLNSQGYDTPKKHMSIVTPEMFEEIIKNFDKARWRKYQEDKEYEKELVKKRASESLRSQEIDRILKETESTKGGMEVETAKPKAELLQSDDETVEYEDVTAAEVEAESDAGTVVTADHDGKRVTVTGKADVSENVTEDGTVQVEGAEAEIPALPDDEGGEVAGQVEGKDRETESVESVVKEAMKLAKRRKPPAKPVKHEPDKAVEKAAGEVKETELEKPKKKKKSRRRKKHRRPEVQSAAARDFELEQRAKISKKKKKPTETAEPAVAKKKRRRTKKKQKIDAREISETIRTTLAQIEDKGKGKRKKRRALAEEAIVEDENTINTTEYVSAQELANLVNVNVNEVIKKSMEMGLLISINQRLDKDTIILLADEFGFSVNFMSTFEEETLTEHEEVDKSEFKPRVPVVTVMGHVDHGKTSLLDYIRKTNIIAGESGGITQHIGAYKVEYDGRHITFLDTPGHEAFTAMRARGAQVTDIVVLVVAADDQVMPQTVEAINHSRAAGVPIIVAINKIDKSNAQPDRVKQQLADQGILVEEWGGKYQCAEISAKYGQNVDKLMEEILLLADLMEFTSPLDCRASGVIIDSRLDRGRGAIATVLIQMGTIKVGDNFFASQYSGKVRALMDERGNKVDSAGPSDPVQIVGFEGTPQAGDKFIVTVNEKEAKNISLRRQQLQREQSFRQIKTLTLDQISDRIKYGEIAELPLVIKCDVHGSVEAIADSLMKLETSEVKVNIIHKGVGAVTESDVLLALASRAIIIGFHVHANKKARELAKREQVEIKSYRIIYDIVNDMKQALEGMLKPEISEEIVGELEVRDIFKISSVGTIAGCHVQEGKIERTSNIRIFREGVEIFSGTIDSLKRFKDDAREVVSGFECGLKVKNFNDLKVGDIIQVYKVVETKRTLSI